MSTTDTSYMTYQRKERMFIDTETLIDSQH